MSTGAAAAAARLQAIKASGVIVTLKPKDWLEIVNKQTDPLVIQSEFGVSAHCSLILKEC